MESSWFKFAIIFCNVVLPCNEAGFSSKNNNNEAGFSSKNIYDEAGVS